MGHVPETILEQWVLFGWWMWKGLGRTQKNECEVGNWWFDDSGIGWCFQEVCCMVLWSHWKDLEKWFKTIQQT